jgi:hypothetical protein
MPVTPVEEHSKCLTVNWNFEIQKNTNYQFGAIGLLENTTSTPESTRAKMKGVVFGAIERRNSFFYNNQYFSGNRDFCCACFIDAGSKHRPCGLSTPDILGTEFRIK